MAALSSAVPAKHWQPETETESEVPHCHWQACALPVPVALPAVLAVHSASETETESESLSLSQSQAHRLIRPLALSLPRRGGCAISHDTTAASVEVQHTNH